MKYIQIFKGKKKFGFFFHLVKDNVFKNMTFPVISKPNTFFTIFIENLPLFSSLFHLKQ